MKKTLSILFTTTFFVMMVACSNASPLSQESEPSSQSMSDDSNISNAPTDSLNSQSLPIDPTLDLTDQLESQPADDDVLPITRQIISAAVIPPEQLTFEEGNEFWEAYKGVDGEREAIVKRGWPRDHWIAEYYMNGGLQKRLAFDETNIHYTFGSLGWAGNDFDHEFIVWWDPVKPILFASCNYTDLTIRIDFEAETVDLIYELRHERFIAKTESPDGQYTLGNASEDGGGDGAAGNTALKKNSTNELRYVATDVSNYGFIDNQFYYLIGYDSFGIHSVDPDVPVKTLDITLGTFEEENITRLIYSCLPLPETDRLVLVYTEQPIDAQTVPSGEHPYNNLIMICNREGAVLRTYDTGFPFYYHKNWPNPIRLYRIAGDETRLVIESNGESWYVFDLTSGDMTPLEDPYNSDIDWIYHN